MIIIMLFQRNLFKMFYDLILTMALRCIFMTIAQNPAMKIECNVSTSCVYVSCLWIDGQPTSLSPRPLKVIYNSPFPSCMRCTTNK